MELRDQEGKAAHQQGVVDFLIRRLLFRDPDEDVMMRSLVVGHSPSLLSGFERPLGVRRRSSQHCRPRSACLQPTRGRRLRIRVSAADSVNNTPSAAINSSASIAPDNKQKTQPASESSPVNRRSSSGTPEQSMLSSENGLIDGEDDVPRPSFFGPSMPSGNQPAAMISPLGPELRKKSWALRSVIKGKSGSNSSGNSCFAFHQVSPIGGAAIARLQLSMQQNSSLYRSPCVN
eukprot:scaffold55257_cov17-Tisochrysis_lutea.AAC.3